MFTMWCADLGSFWVKWESTQLNLSSKKPDSKYVDDIYPPAVNEILYYRNSKLTKLKYRDKR